MSVKFTIRKGVLTSCSATKEKDITIPDTVKHIKGLGRGSDFRSIHISASVESIDELAFKQFRNLSAITVDPENRFYSDDDGVLLSKNQDTLICYPQNRKNKIYTIPATVSRICSYAFIHNYGFKLEKIVIPKSVSVIEDKAFTGIDFENLEIDPETCLEYIGKNKFKFFDKPLVYPKVPVTFLIDPKIRVNLCLGYLANKRIYEECMASVYDEFIQNNLKAIIERAEESSLWINIQPITEYLLQNSPESYKELSNKEKVFILEANVLQNDVEHVKKLFNEWGPFEFTARALGFATVYSSLEMVKVLVENGATFEYDPTPEIIRDYDVVYSENGHKFPVNYSKLIAKAEDSWLMYYSGRYYCYANEIENLFKGTGNYKEIPKSERADIAEYLLSQPQTHFDASAALFYTILWCCKSVAKRLTKNGVELNDYYINLLTTKEESWERKYFCCILSSQDESLEAVALINLVKLLEKKDKRLLLDGRLFDTRNIIQVNDQLNMDDRMLLFSKMDLTSFNKSQFIREIIDRNDADLLKVVFESGFAKTSSQREMAISYAIERKKSDSLAWLIDYKNRTVDLAKEAEKEEKKLSRKLNENPNTVTALKKIWDYTTLADGTLEITSYKGSDLDVEIPAAIGKARVTSIGDYAFSKYYFKENKSRKNNEKVRRAIKRVVIPKGVTRIGKGAFEECRAIEEIVIPETVTEFGENAFASCVSLKEAKIPKGVTVIGWRAFYNCKLFEKMEIPEGVSEYKPNLNIKNPSEVKKVNILEEAVKKGSLQDLIDVLETYKEFKFTARALGIAARIRGIEFVKTLVNHGATFAYYYDDDFQREYEMYQSTATGSYKTQYYLMLIPERLYKYYGYSPMYGVSTVRIPPQAKPLSFENRVEIAKYFMENKKIGVSMDELLFWSLTNGEISFADALIEMGVTLQDIPPSYYSSYYDFDAPVYIGLVTDIKQSVYWNAYVDSLIKLETRELLPVLKRLHMLAERADKKLVISQKMIDNMKWEDATLTFVLENARLAHINEKKALEIAISKNATSSLGLMAEAGWLNSSRRVDGLISFARDNKYQDSLVWLMEYKSKTNGSTDED